MVCDVKEAQSSITNECSKHITVIMHSQIPQPRENKKVLFVGMNETCTALRPELVPA